MVLYYQLLEDENLDTIIGYNAILDGITDFDWSTLD